MPRFLFPYAEELNPLLRPKQRVTKALKRQYRGTESTIGQQGDLMDKYNRIYDSMVKIISTLGEVSNTLKLGTSAARGAEAMGRYVSVVSSVNIELARLLLFISQEVPSLQIFSTSQIESLSGMNNQMVGVVQEIEQIANSLPPAVALGACSLIAFRALRTSGLPILVASLPTPVLPILVKNLPKLKPPPNFFLPKSAMIGNTTGAIFFANAATDLKLFLKALKKLPPSIASAMAARLSVMVAFRPLPVSNPRARGASFAAKPRKPPEVAPPDVAPPLGLPP